MSWSVQEVVKAHPSDLVWFVTITYHTTCSNLMLGCHVDKMVYQTIRVYVLDFFLNGKSLFVTVLVNEVWGQWALKDVSKKNVPLQSRGVFIMLILLQNVLWTEQNWEGPTWICSTASKPFCFATVWANDYAPDVYTLPCLPTYIHTYIHLFQEVLCYNNIAGGISAPPPPPYCTLLSNPHGSNVL